MSTNTKFEKGDISTELRIEREFDAPIGLVWEAMTTREQMARWFFDLETFELRKDFEFEFTVEHNGMTYCHLCKVTEIVPQKKLAFTWRYKGHEGNSFVTFELSAEGKKTRLKLTHEGLETFPQTPEFARKNFEGGWNFIGSAFKDYVENMDREIFITRDFDAPRNLVWEVMANPKHVVNWWGPRGFSTTIDVMDFREGGEWKYVMRGPDGREYSNRSVFKEIVKPQKIIYAHTGERGVQFVSTWSFNELGKNKTRVSSRMLFPSAVDRHFVVTEYQAIEGGKQTLQRLGEYVASL